MSSTIVGPAPVMAIPPAPAETAGSYGLRQPSKVPSPLRMVNPFSTAWRGSLWEKETVEDLPPPSMTVLAAPAVLVTVIALP